MIRRLSSSRLEKEQSSRSIKADDILQSLTNIRQDLSRQQEASQQEVTSCSSPRPPSPTKTLSSRVEAEKQNSNRGRSIKANDILQSLANIRKDLSSSRSLACKDAPRPRGPATPLLRCSSMGSGKAEEEEELPVWPALRNLAAALLIATVVVCNPCLWFNRGYTVWFHESCVLALVLGQGNRIGSFAYKFVALQGLIVTLGWYAAFAYDLYANQRLGHILYWNMPCGMSQYMLDDESDNKIVYTLPSIAMMFVAHALDCLAHPIPTYYFWKCSKFDLTKVCTWNAVIASYLTSRIWSLTHTTYNGHSPGLFYVGYEVYSVWDQDAWLPGLWIPAYVAEGMIYLAIVAWKVWCENKGTSTISLRSPSEDETLKSRVTLSESNQSLPRLLRTSTTSSSFNDGSEVEGTTTVSDIVELY